jgi:hypothetical protein
MRSLRPARVKSAALPKIAVRLVVGAYTAFAGLNAQAADNGQAADLARVALAFGNTVVSTYADGRSQKIWLHPDGSWNGLSRKGSPLAGRWQLKGEKVCLRQSSPPTLPINYCTAFPEHSQLGMQWPSRDAVGTPIRLSLQKGVPSASATSP